MFREGPFAGNDVPLVSRWTGSAGVSWDIYQKYLTLDAVARFFSPRRMDNDSANQQVADSRPDRGRSAHRRRVSRSVFWSFSVQNVFDVQYFEYAISRSTFVTSCRWSARYNAYPLPGRTFLAKAGMKF